MGGSEGENEKRGREREKKRKRGRVRDSEGERERENKHMLQRTTGNERFSPLRSRIGFRLSGLHGKHHPLSHLA